MKKPKACLLSVLLALSSFASVSAQSIVGAWTYGNTAAPDSAGTGLLVFLSNGVYFHAESDNTADAMNGMNGMERGTYTWNSGTGAFTAAVIVNTNGSWGLSDDAPPSISITGDTMDIDGFTLARVTGGDAIVGAWAYGNTLTPGPTGTAVIVFLSNGVYFHAESENTADAMNGVNGMERGTYNWVSGSGAFSSTTLVDTNSGWGLSDGAHDFIMITGDTMDVGGYTLYRVTAVPEPSTYAAIAGVLGLGFAVWRRRQR